MTRSLRSGEISTSSLKGWGPLINVGSSTFLSGSSKNYDFLENEVVDPSRAVRWTHNEGKTNDNTRGREIATCAAVGEEIQTCIHGGGSTSGFQALGGERRAIFFFLRDRREVTE